jgi:kynurenine formamidase
MKIEELIAQLPNFRVFDLEQPRYEGAPILPVHAPGFLYTLHARHEPGAGEARTGASGRIYAAEHSGTHIDALSHQAENLVLHGGKEVTRQIQTPNGFTELGVETIPPLVLRGVLLDVARYRGVEAIQGDKQITRDDLAKTAQQQGTTIKAGDAVLIHTGNGALWTDPETYLAAPGMTGDASQWLADQQVKAVGADNVAWDTLGTIDPELHTSLPGHIILLVRNGIYIVENVFLEELAQQQAYEFLFVCMPLKMRGATGSPVRPIAILTTDDEAS